MALEITVYPHLSPRVVLIDYPQTEATVQEIVDAIRHWEDSEEGMGFDYILDAGGKEELGGGVLVGITVTLRNAQLRFAARPAPITTGVVTTGDSLGKNLIDSGADFVSDGVYEGCTVLNVTAGAMETVIGVAANQLTSFPLQAGIRQDWQVGDNYVVYPNELCQITGGNLVSIDELGAPISPLLQAPNINVVRSSSSSATLSDLDAIQYASYQNAVWLKPSSSTSGIMYPSGTREYPVNNLSDAVAIANAKGFSTIHFLEGMVLSSGTLTGFELVGQSHVLTELTIEASLQCENVTIQNCRISGVLDGGTHIRNCIVGDLTYVNGHIHDSGLTGTIILDGDADAVLFNCGQVDPGNPPVIDMNEDGQDLIITDWSGNILIRNLNSSTNRIFAQLDGGVITLDSTILDGIIEIHGIGILHNNASNWTSLNTDGLLNRETITRVTWDTVWLNTESGVAGTEFPCGTKSQPVNNMADALVIAAANHIEKIHLHGDTVLSGDIEGYHIESHSNTAASVDFNGYSVEGAYFKNISIKGQGTGFFTAEMCRMHEGYQNLDCSLENCSLAGAFTVKADGECLTDNCSSAAGSSFDLNGSGELTMGNVSGVFTITNATDPAAKIGITGYYLLTLASSLTAGQALIAGTGILIDQSAGMTVTQRTLPATVVDEDLSLHSPPTSMAAYLKRIAALVGEYKRIHTIVRDGDGNLTSAVMDVYDNETDYDAQTNPIATYDVDATFVSELLESFGMKPR